MFPALLPGQGLTTGSVRGTVRMADGSDASGARVVVRNEATGFVVETGVAHGRFRVAGLETGGPYSILVRRFGARPRRIDGVRITLGEPVEIEAVLEPVPVQLDSITSLPDEPIRARDDGGTGATLSDSLIHRLPSLNRNVYDFLRLVPQISTRIGFTSGGISGGGGGFRYNQFLTNGVPERSPLGAQPPEFAGGKSLPFEAVHEYEVVIAPFDVRYGDFNGALVNTVTRSGTNRWRGSAFVQGRSDALASGGDLRPSEYQRWLLGFAVSGPIARDRAHLLVATEFQDLDEPMAGPYVGQPESAEPPVPVRAADIGRMEDLLGTYGLSAGSGAAVPNWGTQRNVFARLDASLPAWKSRAVLWYNQSGTDRRAFSRANTADSFPLTSHVADVAAGTRAVALQFFSSFGRSGHQNEFSLSHRALFNHGVPVVDQPIIRAQVPATSGGVSTLLSGTPGPAQGNGAQATTVNLRDVLTLLLGSAHALTLGGEAEWFNAGSASLPNSYGTWTFQSLDSLAAGVASRYDLAQDFGGASTRVTGGQYSLYAGDHWQAGDRLGISLGLRADLLVINGTPPYNALVDDLFGRRTDDRFDREVKLSPRLGFTWNPSATGRDLFRGGAGLFTGRPPLAWILTPLQNYGTGIGALRCGNQTGDLGPPPAFDPSATHPPSTCLGGGTPPEGDVELLAPNLGLSQTFRAALAWERRLPWRLIGTVEGLYSRALSDYYFANLNLLGPQGTDARHREMYGTIDAQGRAAPARVTGALPSVIELQNVAGGSSWQVAISLARDFDRGLAVQASYTWSRVRDVQTPLRVNTRGVINWASRAIAGRHSELDPTVSLNDVPHRLTFAGTWRAPWPKWQTELSFLYVGESGSPFTWLYRGAGGRGDLNADGVLNDPVYVPASALDVSEIVFTGVSSLPGDDNSPAAQEQRIAQQRASFERFISGNSCLDARRGAILVRNSCREPWVNTTAVSIRQAIPIGRQALELQVDLFNVLNLINSGWGRRLTVNPGLLEHVQQVPGSSGRPEPVFRFTESLVEWRADPVESPFQFQFGLRYRM